MLLKFTQHNDKYYFYLVATQGHWWCLWAPSNCADHLHSTFYWQYICNIGKCVITLWVSDIVHEGTQFVWPLAGCMAISSKPASCFISVHCRDSFPFNCWLILLIYFSTLFMLHLVHLSQFALTSTHFCICKKNLLVVSNTRCGCSLHAIAPIHVPPLNT